MRSDAQDVWRFLRSNLWVSVATILAILGLAMALVAIGGLGRVQDQRERDRINDGVAGCQRGNNNRQIQAQQIRDVVTVLVEARSGEGSAQPILDVIEPVLAETPVTDCSEVITGAAPDVPDFPP